MLAFPAAAAWVLVVLLPRPPARGERIGGVGLLDHRAGAEVRVPDRREHERVRLGAVADRAAVVDDVGHAAGEADRGRAGGGQHAGAGAERRAGRAEADDAAAAGQERVQRRAVGRVQVGVVERPAHREHVDVGRQRRGQRGRGGDLLLEAERVERVPELGAADVGHHHLVQRGAAPRGRRRLEGHTLLERLCRRERAGAGRHEDRAVGEALDLDALREQRVQREQVLRILRIQQQVGVQRGDATDRHAGGDPLGLDRRQHVPQGVDRRAPGQALAPGAGAGVQVIDAVGQVDARLQQRVHDAALGLVHVDHVRPGGVRVAAGREARPWPG